jgi:hypothetical protein
MLTLGGWSVVIAQLPPDLDRTALQAVLDPYLAAYPPEADDALVPLRCKCCFDRGEVDTVAAWKFQTNSLQLARTAPDLAKNTDFDIEDLTSRAFRCPDDLGALLLVAELIGVGKGLGSAILTAYDPCRFTVYDYRAGLALQALGYLRDLPAPTTNDPSLPWLRYVAAARDVATRTGWTLRNVDRALWEAGK